MCGRCSNARVMRRHMQYGTALHENESRFLNRRRRSGLGVGGAGFGVVATQTGYPPAFAITAALTLCAIVPARQNRKWRSLRTTGQ